MSPRTNTCHIHCRAGALSTCSYRTCLVFHCSRLAFSLHLPGFFTALNWFSLRTPAAAQLHTLLHLEELQQEVDVRSYDMQGTQLFLSGRYLGLKV